MPPRKTGNQARLSFDPSGEWARALVEESLDGVIVVDRDGLVQFANFAASSLFDREPEALAGKTFGYPVIVGASTEIDILRTDGNIACAEMRATAIGWEGQPACLVLVRDITERKQRERTLGQMIDVLERQVRNRTSDLEYARNEIGRFCTSAVHELRKPLQCIVGYADLLGDAQGIAENPEYQEALEIMRQGACRISEMIGGLNRLAQVEAMVLSRGILGLDQIAADVAMALERKGSGKPVIWTIQGNLQVDADPALVRILLENVIENAWKFSSQVSVPTIEVGQEVHAGGELAFFVRDNGVGIDLSRFGRSLFLPFRKVHNGIQNPGLGIGLATAQRIVRRHGGRIWAESAVGKGSRFMFTLAPPCR